MARADTRTWKRAESEVYADFDIGFQRNPVTGSLARTTNDSAVKQSLRNIILTSREEWPYHPSLGSRVYHLLFEPLDSVTARTLEEVIGIAVQREPRARVYSVRVTPDDARNGYEVTIVFTTINATQPVSFSAFLKRVR